MKNVFKLIIVLVLFSFLLSGCDNLVLSQVKSLQTQTTEFSLFEFFKQLEDGYENLTLDFYAYDQKQSSQYEELYDVFDNSENIMRILRNSVIALDLFYEEENEAYYLYESLNNFTAVKDLSISRNGYRLNFEENLNWNKTFNGESEVDNFISLLTLPTSVEATVSNIVGGLGNTIDLVQSCSFPQNADQIESQIPTNTTDEQGNRVEYVYAHSQTSTTFNASLEKKVITLNENVLSSYKREINIIQQNGIDYLTSKITFTNGETITKTYRLDQQIRNTKIEYNKQVGLLKWDINYQGQGQLMVYGEAYFQGNNKYLVKQAYKVVSLVPNAPYAFLKSFTQELLIDGDFYQFKYVPKELTFESIKDVNLAKFATYNGEEVATTFENISQTANMLFYV